VIQLHGKWAQVDCEGQIWRCNVRGRLKQGKRQSRNPVAVGDWVKFDPAPDAEGAISEVEERRGVLARTSAHNHYMQQVVASNVDQIIVMLSAHTLLLGEEKNDADSLDEEVAAQQSLYKHEADPLLSREGLSFQAEAGLELLDRLLVAGAMAGLRVALAVNKLDLAQPEQLSAILAPYQALGLPIVVMSATGGIGLDELSDLLKDRTSVFAGPSGVGKSSALNALQPGLRLKVGEVMAGGDGRHTTTHVSLLPLDVGGYVVDTPGVRDFGLWETPEDELALWYPEFTDRPGECHYPSCTHSHEPECGIKEAVLDGEIDAGRYRRYRHILNNPQARQE